MTQKPVLHRDDPDAAPLTGNIKVTREDWLKQAMEVLIRDGVERVKVLTLAEGMEVSRSSFYWYFKSRKDLLDALLQQWEETNTAAIAAQADAPAGTITGAVLNVFRCTTNSEMFNTALDFAVRDWARRSDDVRARLEASDKRRVQALSAMFARFGFDASEADVRAKVLYFQQIGYDLAGLNEGDEFRLTQVAGYLRVFTGTEPQPQELAEFEAYCRKYWGM
jgi:AcrR family transcriptional regulator